MPTIAPSYIYAFFALVAVSSILISSFGAYAARLRTIPEMAQLKNLLNYIASEGYKLVALAIATNSTSEVVLQLPSAIGNKHYWVNLRNESSKAWVEGALGFIREGNVTNRVYLPKTVSVFGNYSSGFGPAVLECYVNGATINLHLRTWRENA